MSMASYGKLEDNSFAGKIPNFPGVVAFGSTLRECEDELQSTLEDWIFISLKKEHKLPVLEDIDLNRKILHESVKSL